MEKLTAKGLLILSFTAACAFSAFYLSLIKGVTIVYPHLFYIPIILAGVWYRKKAIYVALFLSFVYILVTYPLWVLDLDLSVNVFERSVILIVIAYIIGLLSEKRAQVEAEIIRERDKFQEVLSTISEIIFIIDRDFKVLELSKPRVRAGIEMEDVDAIPRRYRRIPPSQLIEKEDVIGKKCYKGFWGKEKICDVCPVPSVFENGEGARKVGSFVLADGTMMYLDVEYVPVFDEKGNVIQVIGDMRDITERMLMEAELKSAEEQLRETKDYLDDIIKSSADAIVVVDMGGIVRSWNKAAEGYMGYAADEVIGTSNKKFFADPEEADRIMELVRREGELKNYRTIVLTKDGRSIHISMSAALLKGKNGVPVGTVRVSRDITKEVELEEEIKEKRDNLNLILESMPDGVYIVSKDYEVEFMNKVLIDEFGGQVGGICYKVFHNREDPCPRCKNTEVMKGRTLRWEWHSRRKNKTYDLVETPLKNINGTFSKLTIFRDISERKRMEEELKETKEQYMAIFEHTLTALCVIEADKKISLANKEFESLSGYSRAELVGKDWTDFVSTDDLEQMRNYCDDRRKGEAGACCLFKFIGRDGGLKYVNASIEPVPGETRCIASLLDITELKRKEDKLRETCERLAELDKMKLDFLNVASHEMRSPLSPIIGYASLLEPKLTDKERRYVCNIEKCARELEGMIDRMLELARIDGRRVELNFEEFSITEVLRKVVKNLEPEADAKKQTIFTDIPAIEIRADKQKTAAIFTNLISNAIRYTSEGGRINVKVEDRGEDIRVCVADTGMGIPEEHLPKIFERFYMVDTSLTRKSGSLGLGLSIVKEYVKLHGGRVWATSELGKWSKFFFTLPKGQINKRGE